VGQLTGFARAAGTGSPNTAAARTQARIDSGRHDVGPGAPSVDAGECAEGLTTKVHPAVWTKDVHRAHRVAAKLRAGTVWINAYRVVSGTRDPFTLG
jgi:hypothetical protein